MQNELTQAVVIARRDGLRACLSRGGRYLAEQLLPQVVREHRARGNVELPSDFNAYDHPPDPFATFDISPSVIKRGTGRPYPPYHGPQARLGLVRDGEWDRREPSVIESAYQPRYELYREGGERFEESVYYQSLKSRFEDEVRWQDTPWYRRSLEFIEQGRSTSRGISSRADLNSRCAAIDGLYNRICREGYRSQRDLRNHPAAVHEVTVDIGRNGEFLFVNGRNRLTIAKLLGIETIPVGVYARHREWMDRREAIASGEPIPDAGIADDHPDLRDV